jgi:hypothetical protein
MAEDGHTFLKGPAPGHLCWCNVLQKKNHNSELHCNTA